MKAFVPAVTGALLLVSTSALAAPAPGEQALEARLLAPCCWTTTLDIHESEIATSLRNEIHARLLAGESAQVIEDDFAARFGEKVRAVPRGKDPRASGSVVLGVAMLLAGLGLVFMVRSWATRKPGITPVEELSPRDDEDARLDDELREITR